MSDLTEEGLVGSKSQVFQYDAATGGLVRASIGQNGYNEDDDCPSPARQLEIVFPLPTATLLATPRHCSERCPAPANGAVFFSSPDALTPQALSDQTDFLGQLVPNIYEYRDGEVYLLSDGHNTSAANFSPGVYFAGSDASGDDAFFFTSDSLLASDGDTQQDLYDARVEGGLPAASTSPPGCTRGSVSRCFGRHAHVGATRGKRNRGCRSGF